MMCEMRPTDCSKIARAMGKLDLQDEDLCVTLVDALKVLLPESPPIAVAGIMAGLGMVSYRYVMPCLYLLSMLCLTAFTPGAACH